MGGAVGENNFKVRTSKVNVTRCGWMDTGWPPES